MKMMNSLTITLASLMAAGALAANPVPVAKKKIAQKSLKKKITNDRVKTPQSSAISAASATTSMPSLTAGTSSAAAPASVVAKKRFIDGVRLGVGLEYYGASLADPLSGWQTDKETGYSQGGASHELDTKITLGYAIASNYTLSYNAYFFSHGDSPGDNDGETFRFRAADSYLKLGVGKFLQVGKFKWNGDFRLYPALGSDRKGRVAYYRTGQNFTYAATPRLTLAMYTTLRYYHNNDSAYAPENDKKGNKFDSRFTYGPAIEYQMLDTVGLALSFNDEFAHAHQNNIIRRTETLTGAADYGAYFEVGASIDVSKAVNINPYVDLFTRNPNVETMQLGANLNLTIL